MQVTDGSSPLTETHFLFSNVGANVAATTHDSEEKVESTSDENDDDDD